MDKSTIINEIEKCKKALEDKKASDRVLKIYPFDDLENRSVEDLKRLLDYLNKLLREIEREEQNKKTVLSM